MYNNECPESASEKSSQGQASLTFKALRQENFKFKVAPNLVRAMLV